MIKKSRNSSFELLRIISMFAIVLHHYAFHGTFDWQNFNPKYIETLRVNLFFNFLGNLGVVLFVMIGAYFLCEKRFTFRRPINLIITTAFYSFGIYFILKFCFHNLGIFKPDTLSRTLLPFPLPSGYWFVFAYILMLLAMPCLNIIINNINRQQLLLLILCILLLWSFYPTGISAFSSKPDTGGESFGYTQAIYFIEIYFVSAYVRIYNGKLLNSKKATGILSCLTLIISCLVTLLATNQYRLDRVLDLYAINSPLALLSAIFIFCFFRNVSFHNILVNNFAKSMFAVYLIHDDSFIRPLLWHRWISSQIFKNNAWSYCVHGIIYSLIIFISCIIIDTIIRKKFFRKFLNSITDNLSSWLDKAMFTFIHKN